MVRLAIDTAGPVCAAQLTRSGEGMRVLAARSERLERGHAELLLPMIGETLAEAGLAYSDLTRIAVTTGPGSFTGVRVGVAAARGLALALGVRAVGIGVLDCLLHAARRRVPSSPILAALGIGRGEVAVMACDATGGALLPACAATPDALAALLPPSPSPIHVTGSAARLAVEALSAEGIAARLLDEADAADLLALAELAEAGRGASPPVPLYLRPPDAKPQTNKAIARRAVA